MKRPYQTPLYPLIPIIFIIFAIIITINTILEAPRDTIIGMIDSLSSTNTENISPLYNPLEETARKFNDRIKSDNNKELFLESAPESDENFFLVPKVVD